MLHRQLLAAFCSMSMLAVAMAVVPYTDVFKSAGRGGNSTAGAPVSFWSPSIIVTNNGTVVIVAQCDRKAVGHGSFMCVSRSFDSGEVGHVSLVVHVWVRSFYYVAPRARGALRITVVAAEKL